MEKSMFTNSHNNCLFVGAYINYFLINSTKKGKQMKTSGEAVEKSGEKTDFLR